MKYFLKPLENTKSYKKVILDRPFVVEPRLGSQNCYNVIVHQHIVYPDMDLGKQEWEVKVPLWGNTELLVPLEEAETIAEEVKYLLLTEKLGTGSTIEWRGRPMKTIVSQRLKEILKEEGDRVFTIRFGEGAPNSKQNRIRVDCRRIPYDTACEMIDEACAGFGIDELVQLIGSERVDNSSCYYSGFKGSYVDCVAETF